MRNNYSKFYIGRIVAILLAIGLACNNGQTLLAIVILLMTISESFNRLDLKELDNQKKKVNWIYN